MSNMEPKGRLTCPHCEKLLDIGEAVRARAAKMGEMMNAGMDREGIGAMFGMSPSGVYLSMKRYAVPVRTAGGRGRHPEKRLAVQALLKAGEMDVNTIIRKTGFAQPTVHSAIRALALADHDFAAAYDKFLAGKRLEAAVKRSKTVVDKRVRQMQAMREAGLTLEQVGAAFGVSRERSRQVLNRNACFEEAFKLLAEQEQAQAKP